MSTPSLSLAVGFVNPVLLAGLGLAAAPIVIHLLSRRRFHRIDWAAMRLLRAAEKENRRRVRFEQWLLVALRCAAVALLTLLFARPFVRPGVLAALLGGRERVQRIIVLDDSASLAYRVAADAEFTRLRARALRLLSWLQQEAPDDPVSCYLTSRPEEPLLRRSRLSNATLDDLRAQMERLAPTNLPARPRNVLARVAETLALGGETVRADVYVLSDFQRREWTPGSTTRADRQAAKLGAAGAGDTPDGPHSVFDPIAQLDHAAVRLVLIASGDEPRANVALLEVGLERAQTMAGIPALVTARIANYTPRPLRDLLVRLETDGVRLPPVPVELIPPGQQRDVVLEVTFPEAGYHVLTVAVAARDAYPLDDARRLSVRVKERLAVLVVDGQPDADRQRDEVHLLRNALSPPGPFSSGLRVEVIVPRELEATDLNAYDCVLLCNVPAPGPGAVAALERFVRRGGGLIFFLGSQVGEPGDYNRALYAGGRGLLPLPLAGVAEPSGRPEGVGLTRTGDHPVTAMFPAGGESLGDNVRFWRYYRCDESALVSGGANPPGGGASAASAESARRRRPVVLARYADGVQTPALIESGLGGLGRGRVLLFTSTADLEWNDWPRASDGSYVVTLLDLVQYAARRDQQRLAFVAGEPFRFLLAPDAYELTAVIKSPGFPDDPPAELRVQELAAAEGESVELEGPPPKMLGTYRIELLPRGRGERAGVESRPVCVNLDPVESSLARARREELAAALAGVPHELVLAAEVYREGAQGVGGPASRRELWPGLLLLLAVVLLGEQSLAWWFGRAARVARGSTLGVRDAA